MQVFYCYVFYKIRVLRPINILFTLIIQFFIRCSLIPICLGVSISLLKNISLGLIWLSVLFTLLPYRWFYEDWNDGSLERSYCYFSSFIYLSGYMLIIQMILITIWSLLIFPICILFFGEELEKKYIFILGNIWILQICVIQSSLTLTRLVTVYFPRYRQSSNGQPLDIKKINKTAKVYMISFMNFRKLKSLKILKQFGSLQGFKITSLGLTEILCLPILIPTVLLISYPINIVLLFGYQSFILSLYFLFVPMILEIVIKSE